MTTYMPPIARKKRVEHFNPDTFRVLGHEVESTHIKYEPQPYRASFEPETPVERLFPDLDCCSTRVLPKPTADYRRNNPQPRVCSFINTDVRLLNAPLCTVDTKGTKAEEHLWWPPARANPGKLEPGEHTSDTVYRNDYMYTKQLAPSPAQRHTANPHKEPTRGIAPVTYLRDKGDKQRFFKEGISYEHVYDSRKDPNYPIRTKRHGAFVYSQIDPIISERFYKEAGNEVRCKQGNAMPHERYIPQAVPSNIGVLASASETRNLTCSQNHNQSSLTSPPPQRMSSGNGRNGNNQPGPKMLETGSSPIEFYDSPMQSRKETLLETGSSPIEWFDPDEGK